MEAKVETKVYNKIDGKWVLVNTLLESQKKVCKDLLRAEFQHYGKVKWRSNGVFEISYTKEQTGGLYELKYVFANVNLNESEEDL